MLPLPADGSVSPCSVVTHVGSVSDGVGGEVELVVTIVPRAIIKQV